MDYGTLENFKKTHTALKLLNADNMPLIASFFYRTFILPNKRSIAMTDLVTLLDDYLFYLREQAGENRYTRPAHRF